MCFSIFPFHPSPPLFLLSPLPAKSMFPCGHQNIFVLNYCKYNDLKSCVMFACCPALIVSPSALSNTFLLLSLLFLITIYTGWMDDIPFAEYKYTPYYVLSAHTLFPLLFSSSLPYSCICTTLTPFLYSLYLLLFLYPTFLNLSLPFAFLLSCPSPYLLISISHS